MKITEEGTIRPVQITFEYQHEIDQLYALLNFVPIITVLEEGTGEWKKLRSYLRHRQIDSSYWHARLCQMRLLG